MARSGSDADVAMIGQTPATRELLRRLDLDVRMKLAFVQDRQQVMQGNALHHGNRGGSGTTH